MMAAGRGLRFHTVLLPLLVALVVLQPCLPLAPTSAVTIELTLYAHTDPSAASVDGRVLSLRGNTTSRHDADVRDGLTFTLVPPLSAPLHLLGGIDVYVWLIAQQTIRGTLRVGLSEVSVNASVTEIRSVSVTIPVAAAPYQVQLGLGSVDYTAQAGSALRFEVQFVPLTPVPVHLLWDDAAVSTRLLLEAESIPKIDLNVKDASGKSSIIFPENVVGVADLTISVSVEDPFHGTNIRTVSLNVTDSSRRFLIMNTPMNLTSHTETPFRLGYEFSISLPIGVFNITASVLDAVGRTFLAAKEITVAKFHTMVLMLVDGQQRPIANLNVSLTADGSLLEEVTTNSSGIAIAPMPSNVSIAPILEVTFKGLVILSRPVDPKSSMLVIVVPLYDWNIYAKYQGVGIPASGVGIRLYLNGTLVASATTDVSGAARFASVPLGSYKVTISSAFGSWDYNVTHSAESTGTSLGISMASIILSIVSIILSGYPISVDGVTISLPLILFAMAIAIVAVFALIAVTRRRRKAPKFRHAANLLGGAIPQASVILVEGPSGTGKSILLQNVLADLLDSGRHCVYVSNAELPSNIRKQLDRMGLKVQDYEKGRRLRFIDAYSGETGKLSGEEYSTPSPNDLTALGIQLTHCVDELGGKADVFLDSLTPILSSGDAERGLEFVRYYGARVAKSGGTFLCAATAAIESRALSRLEEASDCVLQIESSSGVPNVIGRLRVKKARGANHERQWVGLKITSKGRIEFVSLPNDT